jgi:hypothetical protein
MTQTLIYGLAAGETERYTEALLSSRCVTKTEVDRVIAAATRDGWHSFRVTGFKLDGKIPDFGATVAEK